MCCQCRRSLSKVCSCPKTGDRPPAQVGRPGLGRPSPAQAGHLVRPLWPGGARHEGHQEVRVHAADAHTGGEFSLFQEENKFAHNMSMTVLSFIKY